MSPPPAASSTDECEERLKELKIVPGTKIMLAPLVPGTKGTQGEYLTNVFGLEVLKDTIIYCYTLDLATNLRSGKTVVFTKKSGQDFHALSRNRKCMDIFLTGIQMNEEFFKLPSGNQLIYDGQNMVFTTINLFEGVANRKDKKKSFQIKGSDIDNDELNNLEMINFELFASEKETIVFSKERLLEYTADGNLDVNDRSLTQFLEIILNQKCARETRRFACYKHGNVFCLNPLDEGYDQSDVTQRDGKELKPGFKKAVNFIEGPLGRGNNNPSLFVDSMKAEFHIEETIIEKIMKVAKSPRLTLLDHFAAERLAQQIKGIVVVSKYTGKTRHLQFCGILGKSAETARFEMQDGRSVTVQEYFKEKYNLELAYPQANLVICKERGNTNYYPAELLKVAGNQRVQIQQNVANQKKDTRECAVVPDVRQRLIVTGMKAAGLIDENKLFEALGIVLYNAPVMVTGRKMASLTLKYDKHDTTTREGKWRPQIGDSFLKIGKVPACWALYHIFQRHDTKFSEEQLKIFGKSYYENALGKGFNLPQPAEIKSIQVKDLENVIENALKHNCNFLLTVTDDDVKDVHNRLKYFERKYEMIIQDVRVFTAIKILKSGGRGVTVENIVAKTNMKFGGLNYAVKSPFLTEDQLVIGIGQASGMGSLPGKDGLAPLILGYSSNAGQAQEFVGDCVFAVNSSDTFSSIEDILRHTIPKFQESRNMNPKRIIVYRSGKSGGEYGNILEFEIPLAKATLKDLEVDSMLTYINVSKDHLLRLFPRKGDSQNPNIGPGLVVDSQVTHPSYFQFYLNSHTTLQGSAKTPQYTVLFDENKASMDNLQLLTYALCHHHQIVSLTTSLPSPLYIATEYAKRGRVLWNERVGSNAVPIPQEADKASEQIAEIANELIYRKTKFVNQRVNA